MSDLNDIAEQIVNWANDGEEVEVYVSRGVDTEVVVYDAQIESLSRAETLGAGIRVINQGRTGFSYAGTLSLDVLRETFEEARDNSTFASVDEFAGLARPDGVVATELDLWREEVLAFPADNKVDMALDLERRVKSADSRIRTVEAAEYGDGAIEAAIASTTGIRAAYRRTGCYVSAYAIAGDGADTQTGGGYSVDRAPQGLDLEKAANDAVERATRLLGATKPKSDRVTVLFDNRTAPFLLSALAAALNGESVSKGRSFLADKVGEKIAVDAFTLVDDPTNPLAYSAGAYDGEGLATRRNVLVQDGVLKEFLYDSYAARRANRKPNGAAVRGGFKGGPTTGARAMVLSPGDLDVQAIIREIENGVLVQSVLGASTGGINPISGDISLGAEGLLIRHGAIEGPVREFTIASTLQEMLMNVCHIGNDIEWLPGSAAGVSIAIDDMALSGN